MAILAQNVPSVYIFKKYLQRKWITVRMQSWCKDKNIQLKEIANTIHQGLGDRGKVFCWTESFLLLLFSIKRSSVPLCFSPIQHLSAHDQTKVIKQSCSYKMSNFVHPYLLKKNSQMGSAAFHWLTEVFSEQIRCFSSDEESVRVFLCSRGRQDTSWIMMCGHAGKERWHLIASLSPMANASPSLHMTKESSLSSQTLLWVIKIDHLLHTDFIKHLMWCTVFLI